MITARVVEELSYADKERHWARTKPWSFKGKAIRLNHKTAFEPNQVKVDDGDIVDMPVLLGKPCFGLITALIRHNGDQPRWDSRFNKYRPSKCMSCPVQSACETVAAKRIMARPQIREAFDQWRGFGRKSFGGPVPGGELGSFRSFEAARAWRGVLHATITHGHFSSCNDPLALDDALRRARARRQRDARKERQKRAETRDSGVLDSHFIEALKSAKLQRRDDLIGASHHPEAPRKVRELGARTIDITIAVWEAKLSLDAMGQSSNNSAIARRALAENRWISLRHNVFRQRVPNDLKRIEFLERYRLPGNSGPIWEPFDPDADLNNSYWRGDDFRS